MTKICISNLKKSYGKKPVLDIPQITFDSCSIIGIFGANGCGKSTLVKCICNLVPYDGAITVDDIDIKQDPSPLSDMGILIEEATLFNNLSGRDNIKYFCKDISRLEEYASVLDVEDILDIKARKYSIGMKQKIAILLACLKGRKTVILDEPFNGLDIISVEKAVDLLRLCKQNGATVLLTSHQLEVSQSAIDLYYLLKNNTIFNCSALQQNVGYRYQIDFCDNAHANQVYNVLQKRNLPCALEGGTVKITLDKQNIYEVIEDFKDLPIKKIEDITCSVKEAYLDMEKK